MDKQVVQLPAKAMFSQALAGVLIASILLATSILTSFAQNDDSEFIKNSEFLFVLEWFLKTGHSGL